MFDEEGRYLGAVRVPFPISGPRPVIRGDEMYAVTADELGVQSVVRGRILKP